MINLDLRIKQEIIKLCSKKFTVKHTSSRALEVILEGPVETSYHGGSFLVKITIPEEYPFRSPSIGFDTKIFHPNIDENSGSVCLDVLNQVWSPLYDISNVVEFFLPQLLTYPNPNDPLNNFAALLYRNDKVKFQKKVHEYVEKYGVKDCRWGEEEEEEESDVMDSDDVHI